MGPEGGISAHPQLLAHPVSHLPSMPQTCSVSAWNYDRLVGSLYQPASKACMAVGTTISSRSVAGASHLDVSPQAADTDPEACQSIRTAGSSRESPAAAAGPTAKAQTADGFPASSSCRNNPVPSAHVEAAISGAGRSLMHPGSMRSAFSSFSPATPTALSPLGAAWDRSASAASASTSSGGGSGSGSGPAVTFFDQAPPQWPQPPVDRSTGSSTSFTRFFPMPHGMPLSLPPGVPANLPVHPEMLERMLYIYSCATDQQRFQHEQNIRQMQADHSKAAAASVRRAEAVARFLKKRNERCFDKKVRYQSRQRLAESRPRVRGQFVKAADLEAAKAVQKLSAGFSHHQAGSSENSDAPTERDSAEQSSG